MLESPKLKRIEYGTSINLNVDIENQVENVKITTPLLSNDGTFDEEDKSINNGELHMSQPWWRFFIKYIPLVAGPLLMIPFSFDILYPGNVSVSRCAGIVLWIGIWWFFEPIPMPVTSMLPVILFPLFGVAPVKDVAGAYFNDLTFLFIGSYIVAIGLEKWLLHKRFALLVLLSIGPRPKLILLGFMSIAFFLSMWLSNSCTAAMLLPMAHAVLQNLGNGEKDKLFSKAVILGIPYSCSIGGISTLIGTATNLVFAHQFELNFPKYGSFGFIRWFIFALPLSFLFLVVSYFIFLIRYVRNYKLSAENATYFKEEYSKLGKIKMEEITLIVVFILMCALWIFRELPFGENIGWGALFKKGFVTDGVVGVIIGALLFIIPSKNRKGETIMDWKTANKKLPWSIILLLGAGFSLAKAFDIAGFAQFLASIISSVGSLPSFAFLAVICMSISLLTEISSNVAIASIILPVLAKLAISPQVSQNPLFLMIPATISCSFAFMTPIGTPPNAIAFGYGSVKIKDMVIAGFVLNFIGIGLLIAWTYLAGPLILGIELRKIPEWALP